jgi:hypothetical protein
LPGQLDEHEPATADAARRRADDTHGERRGYGCVNGVAARLQDLHPGLGRQRMLGSHHAARAHGSAQRTLGGEQNSQEDRDCTGRAQRCAQRQVHAMRL